MAELHSAFYWDCEHCGEENYMRALCGVMHMPPLMHKMLVDRRLILQADDPEPGEPASAAYCRTHRVSLAPSTLTCKFCGHRDLAVIENTEIAPKLVSDLPDIGNLDPAFADAALADEEPEDALDDDDVDDEWDAEDEDWDEDEIDELDEDDFGDDGTNPLQGGPYGWMFSTPFEDDEDDD
jgi:hypothetical protein